MKFWQAPGRAPVFLIFGANYGKSRGNLLFSVCWTEGEACLERKTTENGT